MARERVVIDTNVLISGLFSTTSTQALAVEKAITKAQLVATNETLRELIERLLLAKFDRYVSRERREALLQRVASLVEIVEVLQHVARRAMRRMTSSSTAQSQRGTGASRNPGARAAAPQATFARRGTRGDAQGR